jgi:folate-dependent tRNA-U54 methylase TrmFO/GidA
MNLKHLKQFEAKLKMSHSQQTGTMRTTEHAELKCSSVARRHRHCTSVRTLETEMRMEDQ